MPDAKVIRFPTERTADNRIPFVDAAPYEPVPSSIAGKPPPHDLNAERVLLREILSASKTRALMLEHGAADPALRQGFENDLAAVDRVVESLRPEYFYSHEHGRVFQVIQQLYVRKTPVDFTTVRAEIARLEWLGKVGGEGYLLELMRVDPTVNIEAHAAIVVELWEKRQHIDAHLRGLAELHGEVGPWEQHKAGVRAEWGKLTAPRSKVAGTAIGVAADEAHRNVKAVQAGAVPGVPWCFDALDHFGLIAEGKQHILAARPGMGKTALAFQVGVRVSELWDERDQVGEAVYWCSWEMARADLLEREACSLAGISYKSLQRQMVGPEGQERLAAQLRRLRALPIWIDDDRCTPLELAERVRGVRAMFAAGHARRADKTLYPKCRMRLVAIDQLSEARPPADLPPRADVRQVVGATAKGFQRDVAKALRVATLLLCQIGRPKPGQKVEEPTLAELRESGQIEESADEVIALHRPQYYQQKCPAELRNIARVIPLKGRYGHEAPGVLGFYGGRFDDALPAAARGVPHYDE